MRSQSQIYGGLSVARHESRLRLILSLLTHWGVHTWHRYRLRHIRIPRLRHRAIRRGRLRILVARLHLLKLVRRLRLLWWLETDQSWQRCWNLLATWAENMLLRMTSNNGIYFNFMNNRAGSACFSWMNFGSSLLLDEGSLFRRLRIWYLRFSHFFVNTMLHDCHLILELLDLLLTTWIESVRSLCSW